jgi:hypothetical protein
MAELEKAWSEILDRNYDSLTHFGTFQLKVYTDDGLTAQFYEEGIDFYPKEESDG